MTSTEKAPGMGVEPVTDQVLPAASSSAPSIHTPSNSSIRSYTSQDTTDRRRWDSVYDDERAQYAMERDDRLWSSLKDMHGKGFIRLVSSDKWYLSGVARFWAWIVRAVPQLEDLEAGKGGELGYRINFADLHRAHLRYLQVKLIGVATDLEFYDQVEGDGQPQYNPWKYSAVANELGQTMKDYTQGIRDLEYMSKFSTQRNDPFIASSERKHDDKCLHNAAERWKMTLRSFQRSKKQSPMPTGPWEKIKNGTVEPIGGTRGQFQKKALSGRIGAATVGGVFLVVPMWVLSLKTEIMFQLGFTTGCVALFGIFMSWSLSTISEVFQATLAYAAVLMVFIGVILQTSSSAAA